MSNGSAGEGHVTTTHAEVTAPRIAGVVDAIDRFLPLGWLAFYAVLPVSGWAPSDVQELVRPEARSRDARVRPRIGPCGRDQRQRHRAGVHRRCRVAARRTRIEPRERARGAHTRFVRSRGRRGDDPCPSARPEARRSAWGWSRSRRSSYSWRSSSRPGPGTGRTFPGATSSRCALLRLCSPCDSRRRASESSTPSRHGVATRAPRRLPGRFELAALVAAFAFGSASAARGAPQCGPRTWTPVHLIVRSYGVRR